MRQINLQSVLETGAAAQAGLGERGMTPDGRVWRYVKFNEATSLGHLVQHVANTDVDTVSSSTDNDGVIRYITEASAGWTAGAFAGAFGLVDDGTGEGQGFIVEDNTADTLTLKREYALTTAMAVADSDIVLVRPYLVRKAVITALLGPERGFCQVAAASADHGWVLESGPGFALAGAALVIDEYVTAGDDTAGEVIGVGSGETVDDVTIVARTLVANTTADKLAMVEAKIV